MDVPCRRLVIGWSNTANLNGVTSRAKVLQPLFAASGRPSPAATIGSEAHKQQRMGKGLGFGASQRKSSIKNRKRENVQSLQRASIAEYRQIDQAHETKPDSKARSPPAKPADAPLHTLVLGAAERYIGEFQQMIAGRRSEPEADVQQEIEVIAASLPDLHYANELVTKGDAPMFGAEAQGDVALSGLDLNQLAADLGLHMFSRKAEGQQASAEPQAGMVISEPGVHTLSAEAPAHVAVDVVATRKLNGASPGTSSMEERWSSEEALMLAAQCTDLAQQVALIQDYANKVTEEYRLLTLEHEVTLVENARLAADLRAARAAVTSVASADELASSRGSPAQQQQQQHGHDRTPTTSGEELMHASATTSAIDARATSDSGSSEGLRQELETTQMALLAAREELRQMKEAMMGQHASAHLQQQEQQQQQQQQQQHANGSGSATNASEAANNNAVERMSVQVLGEHLSTPPTPAADEAAALCKRLSTLESALMLKQQQHGVGTAGAGHHPQSITLARLVAGMLGEVVSFQDVNVEEKRRMLRMLNDMMAVALHP